jgi:hypothetical protein
VHKAAQHLFVTPFPAQLALERSRADHFAAEAATRQAAAADCEQLAAQLEQAQREVAVKQALCEGWQRANQVRHQLQLCKCGQHSNSLCSMHVTPQQFGHGVVGAHQLGIS